MSNNFVLAAVIAFIVGMVLFFRSSKKREANGEWSSSLQWGYLLMMVGIFGVLSSFMSFTAVLLVFVLFTGLIWVIHKARTQKQANHSDNNHFTDYMSGFFPIILVVFVLRTFVSEPFQIPSSSMRPGLIVGDFILVNKFSYGIRTPVINNVLIPVGNVARGDVVVFNYPENPKVNYIKRAIGLPGDTVEYKNKLLTINGQPVPDVNTQSTYRYDEVTQQYGMIKIDAGVYQETLGKHTFNTLKIPDQPTFMPQAVRPDFPYKNQCEYAEDSTWFKCKVPPGHYFMMGDNRDNSEDSRYWGFVSDKLIVGKAYFIWMNFSDMSRIGTIIH